jgi:Xaa-Pro aminopeptidase
MSQQNSGSEIKSATEIALLRASAKIAEAGILAGFTAAVPGATQFDVELSARKACLSAGAEKIHHVQVMSGIPVQVQEPLAPLAEGDFVYLQVSGWAQGYAFYAARARVIGTPTPQQQDYLQHLKEATGWMVENLEADKKVTFCYTESRGRELHPKTHGIGLELVEKPQLETLRKFLPRQGMVLCVAPEVVSKTFGRMSYSMTIVLDERGAKIITG